jgi:HAD superfamily 5'-nucleotidase-like hydrolase
MTYHLVRMRAADPAGPADLLREAAPELPRERRVFVNRNLRMSAIEMIGFDMDYTLAVYRQEEVQRLSVAETVRKLVEKKGYPAEVAALEYDPSLSIRGLCVDTRNGNLFKMDRHGHVGRVFHGRTPLSRERRRDLYHVGVLRPRPPRYAWVDHLFALPEGAIFARLVDWLDERGGRDYARLWRDIRECIDEAHRDESLKSEIKAHLDRYLVRDPDLPATLHKFRSSGKRLFLLTNSRWDYTDALMTYLLDGRLQPYPSWRNYFDVVVVAADKPRFFTGRTRFVELDASGRAVGEPRGQLLRGRIYERGNLRDFEAMAGGGGDRVLYVGDHIYGDMLRSKKSSGWRTALVVQELEEEIRLMARLGNRFERLGELEQTRAQLDSDLTRHQNLLKALQRSDDAGEAIEAAKRQAKAKLDRVRAALRAALDESEALAGDVDRIFNPHWGALFRQGNESSKFGAQVEDYACVYTGRVSNFLWYSPVAYFRAPRDHLPHELG